MSWTHTEFKQWVHDGYNESKAKEVRMINLYKDLIQQYGKIPLIK